MTNKAFYFIIILILTNFACQDEGVQPKDENLPQLRAISASEQAVVAASNNFAFNLMQKIEQQEAGNYFISPLSVSYALAMTANGAGGNTEQEIRQVLDFGDLTRQDMNQAFRELSGFLLGLDQKTKLEIANSIWFKNDLEVKPTFQNDMEKYYEAGVKGLDFSDQAAVNTINEWISDKTEGKINDVLQSIPPEAVMYLINALYFKADWRYQFEESKTQKDDFYTPEGVIQVDMMESEGAKLNYFQNDFMQLIDIPYGNGQFSMSIIMPHAQDEIENLAEQFNLDNFNDWVSEADTITTKLFLPKFKLEYKTSLNQPLQDLGIKQAFTNKAEFPDLFENELPLEISKVIHQTFLEIDEKGSEAAAVTVVEIGVTSIGGGQPAAIRVNKPFILVIREKHSNTLLFMGKILNPAGQ